MSEVIDDKAQYVLPFILERLHAHQERHMGEKNPPLFIIGMNGVQGAGKTTMVRYHSTSHLLCTNRFFMI